MDALSTQQVKVLDTTSSTSNTVESSLPKGEPVKATIRQVSPDQANSNSHKIKLQINNSLIEISAKLAGPPPPAGSSVTLQRSESGQIQIQFSSTTTQTPTTTATTSQTTPPTTSAAKPVATTPFVQSNNGNTILNAPAVINASGKELSLIEKILPKGESVFARVINQPTSTAQVKPNINAASSFAISNSQTPAVAPSIQSSQQNIQRTVSAVSQQSTTSSAQTLPTNTQTAPQATLNNTGATTATTANITSPSGSLQPTPTNAINQQGQTPQNRVPSTLSSPAVSAPPAQIQAAAQTPNNPVANVANNSVANANSGPNSSAINNSVNNPLNSPTANGQTVNTTTTPSSTPVLTSTPATASPDGSRVLNPSVTSSPAPPALTAEKPLNSINSPPQPLAQTTTPVNNSALRATTPSLPTQTPSITNQASTQEAPAKTSTPVLTPQTTPATSAKIVNQTTNQQAPAAGLIVNNSAKTQTAAPAPVNPTTTAPVNQNAQLQGLQQQTSTLKVSVSGQFISLQAPANLPPLQNIQITRAEGTQANLQWQKTSFQPATATASGLQLTSREVQVLEQSLRQVLPQQIPTAEGINQLVQQSAQIANATSAAKAPVDKVVLSILQLFGVKPGAQNSSDTIKSNVQQGGLFTENKVANQNLQQAGMKGFLAKLNFLAEQLPTEQKERLRNTTERMLARVTANQITHVQQQHVKADVSNERTFQLDLPVQHNEKLDNVEMEIKQRKHTTEDGDFVSIWSVKLHFDLEQRGEVDAEVALNPVDNSISTTFLCSKMSTVHEIEQKMQNFRSQLNQQGFEIQTLHCSQGSQSAQANNPISKRILDIRT